MGVLCIALTACGRHGNVVAEAGSATLPVAVSMQDAGPPQDASLADRRATDSGSGLARDVETRAAAARARFDGARIETVGGIFVLAEIGTHSALFDKAA